MTPLSYINGVAAALPASDIDTDQILPARFMHTRREHYGRYCFHDLRFSSNNRHGDGAARDGFVLNQPPFRATEILVTGENFGCGSSREQAVHTVADFGIRALIGTTFGDIFSNNCLKNGLLPIRLTPAFVTRLFDQIAARPGLKLAIDLPAQRVTAADGSSETFLIAPFHKEALLAGLDEIDVTLGYEKQITEYERKHGISTA